MVIKLTKIYHQNIFFIMKDQEVICMNFSKSQNIKETAEPVQQDIEQAYGQHQDSILRDRHQKNQKQMNTYEQKQKRQNLLVAGMLVYIFMILLAWSTMKKEDRMENEQISFQDEQNNLSNISNSYIDKKNLSILNNQKQITQVISQKNLLPLQESDQILNLEKNKDIKQLPFCIISEKSQNSNKIIRSIQDEKYNNYKFIDLNKSAYSSQLYTVYKNKIISECTKNSILIFIKDKIEPNILSTLNQIHQKYDAWVTYRNEQAEYSVLSFYFRIFQLLQFNDFQSDNIRYLQEGNYELFGLGILELGSMHTKNLSKFEMFKNISPLKVRLSQIQKLNRTPYAKLFKLSQDYKTDMKMQQQRYANLKLLKIRPYIQLNPQKMKKAIQRQQLLYLPENHSIAQIQRAQAKQILGELEVPDKDEHTRFCVTVLSNNNIPQNRYKKVLISIFQQEYENYHVVFFDDFSSDQNLQKSIQFTKEQGFKKQRIIFIKNNQRMFATYSIVNSAFNFCKSGEVQLLVDGDDELIGKQAFSMINNLYTKSRLLNEEKWIVYSNFKSNLYNYGTSQRLESMDLVVKDGKRIRKHVIGPIRTWRVELVQSIPLAYHQNKTGHWLDTLYDDAIQHSLIELSGLQRIQYFPEILYEYNKLYGNNDDSTKQKKTHRARTYKSILSLAPLERLQKIQGVQKQKEVEEALNQDFGKKFTIVQW